MRLSDSSRTFYSSTDLLNSVELAWAMRVLASQIFFSLEADVGWYVSGAGQNRLSIAPPSMEAASGSFSQSLGGFFTDAQLNLGTAFGSGAFQLLPQASFGVFYQQIKAGESRPSTETIFSSDLSHSRLKRLWFGPGVGGDLIYRPHSAWILSAGYLFYFLHFDQKFDLFSDLVYSSPVFTEYFIWQKYRTSFPAQGQKLYGNISAQIALEWRLNLRFDAYLFSSQKKNSSLRQNFQQVFPVDDTFSEVDQLQTRATWQAYAALVEIEYFF